MWKIISNVTLSRLVVRHSSSLYFTGQRPCICSPLSPSKEFINRSIFQCNFNIIIQICSIVICLERKINHTQAPCSDSLVCMDPLFMAVCHCTSVHGLKPEAWKTKRTRCIPSEIAMPCRNQEFTPDLRSYLSDRMSLAGLDVEAWGAHRLLSFACMSL